LWIINDHVEKVFLITEQNFERISQNCGRNIDHNAIVDETMSNVVIISTIEYLIEISTIKVDRTIAEDALLSMTKLYSMYPIK